MLKAQRTANPHIQILETNVKGRDFVVGDIHGCVNALKELMGKMGFDPEKDRLFCTGDLTHRGPQSLEALALLNEPWFLSVKGNHDEATIAALSLHFGTPSTSQDAYYRLAKDGGLWLCELVAKSFSNQPHAASINLALSEALANLTNIPKILVIGEGKERYHIVHSFLIKNESKHPDHPDFKTQCLLTKEEIDEVCRGEKILEYPSLLSHSKHVGAFVKNLPEENTRFYPPAPNQPITFCGHTPLKNPKTFLGHVHLDTGAGKPDRDGVKRKLTAINVNTGDIFQVHASCPEPPIEPKDYAKKVGKALEKGKPIPPSLPTRGV